jgi:ubiquinone/menaquinone biosynthesis C-methylase UbiE
LPSDASYTGVDLSDTMLALSQQRLASYGERARLILSSGDLQFPLADQSVDRVMATYVLDLLSESDIKQVIDEARRVLLPGGKLCLVSLSQGINVASRLVCRLWSVLFRLHAPLVGGCRPIRLLPYFDRKCWHIEYHHVLTQFGVPSEILIATPL